MQARCNHLQPVYRLQMDQHSPASHHHRLRVRWFPPRFVLPVQGPTAVQHGSPARCEACPGRSETHSNLVRHSTLL